MTKIRIEKLYLTSVRDKVYRIVKKYILTWPNMKYYSDVQFFPIGDGTPYITYENGSYTIIIEERSTKYESFTGFSFDEAVRYFIFVIAQAYTSHFELTNREGEKYSRWNWMKQCIDIIVNISENYK